MKAGMVWSAQFVMSKGPLAEGAHIGTHLLHVLLPELDLLQWWAGDPPTEKLAQYDVLFVNLFADDQLIADIRRVHPSAYVVAIPDSSMDEVFLNRDWSLEDNFLKALAAADAIGVVSESNAQFYSVFGKPILRIPMPIGTPTFLEQCRLLPKEDYVIAVDHGNLVVNATIQQVAALALIQRETGLPVKYVFPAAHTERYAAQFGLRAEFLPYQPGHLLWWLVAKARLAVDLYARHGAGRHEIVCAAVGTPVIGSLWTGFRTTTKSDPWSIEWALNRAKWVLDLPPHDPPRSAYESEVERNRATVEQYHTFEAVTQIMHNVLQEVETLWQRSPRSC